MTLNKIKEQLIDDEFVNKIVVLQNESTSIKLGTDNDSFLINRDKNYRAEILKNANDINDLGTQFIDIKADGSASKLIINAGSNELTHQELNSDNTITKEAIIYDTYNISTSNTTPTFTLKNGYQHQVYS